MTEQQLWERFVALHPEERETPYEAWQYGSDDPDQLARLTVAGMKTATASGYPFYEYEHCPLPKTGDTSLILYTDGSAACIIRTVKVSVVPFLQVPAEHAFKEGEGDRSLAFWRSAHKHAFGAELTEIRQEFSEDMLVVCEEFEMLLAAE